MLSTVGILQNQSQKCNINHSKTVYPAKDHHKVPKSGELALNISWAGQERRRDGRDRAPEDGSFPRAGARRGRRRMRRRVSKPGVVGMTSKLGMMRTRRHGRSHIQTVKVAR